MQQYTQPQTQQQQEELPIGGNDRYDEQQQEFLRYLTDTEDVLVNFEQVVLRGRYKTISDTGEEMWVDIPNTQPIINEMGIRELMGRLRAKVSKFARFTNKTEEEIYKDMFYFDMSITETISKRSTSWELNIETAKMIKDACIELTWDVVAASRDGFTAINTRTQYSKNEITRSDSSTQPQSRGFFGGILGGKK